MRVRGNKGCGTECVRCQIERMPKTNLIWHIRWLLAEIQRVPFDCDWRPDNCSDNPEETSGGDHELDEALRPKPLAEARLSKRVPETVRRAPVAAQCEKAYEHKVTQRYAAQEWTELLQGTAKGQPRLEEAERPGRDTTGERVAKRRPVDPAICRSASASDDIAGGDAASAGKCRCRECRSRCGSRLRDIGCAAWRRTSPREGEDDEGQAKRQRTEKTELEMEMSNVAKIKDSQRILRPDGWELENINHSDAAMFCTCGLRPR